MVGATLPLWIPASARMTNSVAGDNYFRTNRSCRLVPAHQGMKTVALIGRGVCGSFATHTPPLDSRLRGNDEWKGSGVVRAPYPSPSWGQAPALHFSFDPRLSLFGRRWLVPPAGAGTRRYENEAWSLEVFGCGWCHPFPLDSRFRENDEFGGRGQLFSYESLMPAGAGTPRYEKRELWFGTANRHGGFC